MMCRLSLLLLLSVAPLYAQDVAEADLIVWTSHVGRMLYSYHSAYDVAAATVSEHSGTEALPPLYAAGPYDDGWAFSFGDLDDAAVFVLCYGVIVDGGGRVVQFDAFDYRRVASPHHTLAALALASVREDFRTLRQTTGEFTARVYRYAVLPFPRGQWTAFVSPAQTTRGVTLLGNDVMYTLSRDEDAQVLDRTRFHYRLMELPHEVPQGAVAAALMVPDAPILSPVDVAHAMERNAPLVVLAKHRVYEVAPDGTVRVIPDEDPVVRALRASN